MFKVGNSKRWLSDTPKISELNKLSINELIAYARYKRSIKYPFKKMLVDYVAKIYKAV